MNAREIATMTGPERIAALEAIWDSLIHCDEEMESPDWHQDVLNARQRRMGEPGAQLLSLAIPEQRAQ
jgi:hypothetical protein